MVASSVKSSGVRGGRGRAAIVPPLLYGNLGTLGILDILLFLSVSNPANSAKAANFRAPRYWRSCDGSSHSQPFGVLRDRIASFFLARINVRFAMPSDFASFSIIVAATGPFASVSFRHCSASAKALRVSASIGGRHRSSAV